jgi:disulfide bond formation protein DsbB
MLTRIPTRAVFAAIFVACTAMVLTAIFYFQEELGLEPCPMCILSRYTFITIAVVSLVAAIHGPRGLALRIYASIVGLLAIAGIGVSLRHSYLQHFPPKVESCGADLDFLLNTLPLAQAMPRIFQGTGSCSKVDWSFLALSIPEWAGVWYLGFLAVMVWTVVSRPRLAQA